MTLGFQVEHHSLVGSTNDLARDRAIAGADAGLVIRADQQTSGRGRRGRAWTSPIGNLYCSLLLRPACSPARAATLSFVTVVALGDVLAELLPHRPVQHKWPNDVLIEGKKTSGILLETAGTGTERLDWLVIGLGVNVVSHPDQALYATTDLTGEGAEIAAPDLLDRFLAKFALHYETWSQGGFAALLPAWKARAVGIGGDIVVRLDNQTLEGRFADLDGEGMLMLNMADGRTRRIAAGDVFLPGQMQTAPGQTTQVQAAGTANQG